MTTNSDEEIIEKTWELMGGTIYEAFDRVNTDNFNEAYEIAFEIVMKEHLKKALSMKDGQKDKRICVKCHIASQSQFCNPCLMEQNTDEILELIEKEWTICGDKECKPCKSFEKIHQKITAMGKGEK